MAHRESVLWMLDNTPEFRIAFVALQRLSSGEEFRLLGQGAVVGVYDIPLTPIAETQLCLWLLQFSSKVLFENTFLMRVVPNITLRLIKLGWVERIPCPSDSRRFELEEGIFFAGFYRFDTRPAVAEVWLVHDVTPLTIEEFAAAVVQAEFAFAATAAAAATAADTAAAAAALEASEAEAAEKALLSHRRVRDDEGAHVTYARTHLILDHLKSQMHIFEIAHVTWRCDAAYCQERHALARLVNISTLRYTGYAIVLFLPINE